MEIVANNNILRFFKNISIFKIDLGTNLKGPAPTGGPLKKNESEFSIKIRDEFVKKYQTLAGKFIMKYGEIGSLKFYEDNSIPINEFHIYDKEKIYEICANSDDLKKDPSNYLTEVIQMIENGENEQKEEENKIKNVIYTNMPEDLMRPDMNLPKDQYIEALVNRKKLLNKLQ